MRLVCHPAPLSVYQSQCSIQSHATWSMGKFECEWRVNLSVRSELIKKCLALFPGLLHLQFLITCSMQKWTASNQKLEV